MYAKQSTCAPLFTRHPVCMSSASVSSDSMALYTSCIITYQCMCAGTVCVAVRSVDGDFRFRCKFPVYTEDSAEVDGPSKNVTSLLMTSLDAADVIRREVGVGRWQAVMAACVVGAAMTTFLVNVLIIVGVRRRRRDVIAGVPRRRPRHPRDDVIGWGLRDVISPAPMNNAVARVWDKWKWQSRRLSELSETRHNNQSSVAGRGHVTSHLPHHVTNNGRF